MQNALLALTMTAAGLGFVHTLLGPDHYLPFIAMSRARNWSPARTAVVTALCGIGHVGSSVLLGTIGIALGLAVAGLEAVESLRGDLAAWGLIAFGLVYLVWGLRRAWRGRTHEHGHEHHDAASHAHEHDHGGEHAHVHDGASAKSLTPWVLFTIFVFGPCEPLIPVLMYPAATSSVWGVILVAATFSIVTIGTMLGVVLLAVSGVRWVAIGSLARYGHALAGAVVLACGIAVKLGL